jgi:hypothetical protein
LFVFIEGVGGGGVLNLLFPPPQTFLAQTCKKISIGLCKQFQASIARWKIWFLGWWSMFLCLGCFWCCEALCRGCLRQKIYMGGINNDNVIKVQTLFLERTMSTWHLDVWNIDKGITCNCSQVIWKVISFAMDAKTS